MLPLCPASRPTRIGRTRSRSLFVCRSRAGTSSAWDIASRPRHHAQPPGRELRTFNASPPHAHVRHPLQGGLRYRFANLCRGPARSPQSGGAWRHRARFFTIREFSARGAVPRPPRPAVDGPPAHRRTVSLKTGRGSHPASDRSAQRVGERPAFCAFCVILMHTSCYGLLTITTSCATG